MKWLTSVILILFTICFFISCTKDNNKTRTIHGQALDSTTNLPIGNSKFTLLVSESEGALSFNYGYSPFPFKTDSFGNFDVAFIAQNAADLLIMDTAIRSLKGTVLRPIWIGQADKKKYDFNTGIIYSKKR